MKATIQCEHQTFIAVVGTLFLMTTPTETTYTRSTESNGVTTSARENQSSTGNTMVTAALNNEIVYGSTDDVGSLTHILNPSTAEALNSSWNLISVLINMIQTTQSSNRNASNRSINTTSGKEHYFTKTSTVTSSEKVLRLSSTTSAIQVFLKHYSTGNTELPFTKTETKTNYTVHPPKLHTTVFTSNVNSAENKNLCLEKNNKNELVICLIIIGVLAMLCTVLLISTVVLKNQLSNFKKANHKLHRGRNNADFLTRTSLWPAGSDTWNMRSNLSESSTMLQEVNPKIATVEKTHGRQKESSINTDGNKEKKESKAMEDERRQTKATASFVLEI